MQIINLHDYDSYEDVLESFGSHVMYIGRYSSFTSFASHLQNPFAIGKDGIREQVVEKYRHFLNELIAENDPRVEMLEDVTEDTVFACWCHPKACHADVLVDWWRKDHPVPNGKTDLIYLFPACGSLRKDRSLITSNLKTVKKRVPDADLKLGVMIYNHFLNMPTEKGTYVSRAYRADLFLKEFTYDVAVAQFPTSERVGYGVYQSKRTVRDQDELKIISKSFTAIKQMIVDTGTTAKVMVVVPWMFQLSHLSGLFAETFAGLNAQLVKM